MFRWQGTDPAATFLHRLTEKHDIDDTVFVYRLSPRKKISIIMRSV